MLEVLSLFELPPLTLSSLSVQILCLFTLYSSLTQANANLKDRDEFYYGEFPSDFKWGMSSSSYQIEGGWNEGGKGVNIWDDFVHKPDSIIHGGHTGDISCDSYHKYLEDVKLLKNMNAQVYRFSLAWARIIPEGLEGSPINQEGIDYYNNLINALLAEGIEPFITLYHWDLPLPLLNDLGGWPSGNLTRHFVNFAKIAFEKFGDRVKFWATINEPWIDSQVSYAYGQHPPGTKEPAELPYQSIHNLLLAHGMVYRLYEKEFKVQQGGQVGIALDLQWYEPKDPEDPEHVAASERCLQFNFGICANPIVRGDYPEIVKTLVDKKSKAEGRDKSRLPLFTTEEKKMLKGAYDFIGLNHYTSREVVPDENDGGGWLSFGSKDSLGIDSDQDVKMTGEPLGPLSGAANWLQVVPWGFRKVLGWISRKFENPPVYVLENGIGLSNMDSLEDAERVSYYKLYTNEMLKAINIDKCNVKGYTAWSLLDSFEWAAGYSISFGVHRVNFTDPDRARTPRASAKFLSTLFENNGYFPKTQQKSEL